VRAAPEILMSLHQPAPLLIDLGRSLRRLRAERGISQEQLARQAGLHPNFISHIERGKDMRLTTLLRILEALEASPAELGLWRLGTEPPPAGRARASRPAAGEDRKALVDRLDDAQRLLADMRAVVLKGGFG
jgi:transcriptional regulator with XRE-family HTH domain